MAGESQGYLSGNIRRRRKPLRFYSYYGSKNGSAASYPAPYWQTIVEPCAGAAGYSTLYFDRQVYLYDLDPIICGIWDFLIRCKPAEVLQLPIVSDWQDERLNDFPIEARHLIGFWLAMGQPTPYNRQTSYAATRARSSWSEEIRYRLSLQTDLINHWRIEQCSYESINFAGPATWFVDPPYQKNGGKLYTFGNGGIDYKHLGQWCREREGQVIVCEAGEADWLPFEFFAHGKTSMTRSGLNTNRELMYHQFNGRQV